MTYSRIPGPHIKRVAKAIAMKYEHLRHDSQVQRDRLLEATLAAEFDQNTAQQLLEIAYQYQQRKTDFSDKQRKRGERILEFYGHHDISKPKTVPDEHDIGRAIDGVEDTHHLSPEQKVLLIWHTMVTCQARIHDIDPERALESAFRIVIAGRAGDQKVLTDAMADAEKYPKDLCTEVLSLAHLILENPEVYADLVKPIYELRLQDRLIKESFYQILLRRWNQGKSLGCDVSHLESRLRKLEGGGFS